MGGSAATPGSFASSTAGLGMYATVHGAPRGSATAGGGHKASASLAEIRRRAVAEEQEEEVGETY